MPGDPKLKNTYIFQGLKSQAEYIRLKRVQKGDEAL